VARREPPGLPGTQCSNLQEGLGQGLTRRARAQFHDASFSAARAPQGVAGTQCPTCRGSGPGCTRADPARARAQFHDENAAARALQGLAGRFYAGRPILIEFSPVTDFREATCRQYEENTCTRGGYCNFMHLRPISKCAAPRAPAPGGAARPRAHPPRTRALSRSGGFAVLGLESASAAVMCALAAQGRPCAVRAGCGALGRHTGRPRSCGHVGRRVAAGLSCAVARMHCACHGLLPASLVDHLAAVGAEVTE